MFDRNVMIGRLNGRLEGKQYFNKDDVPGVALLVRDYCY